MMKNVKLLPLVMACLFSSLQMSAQQANKTIDVHARRYAFTPPDITVTKGETVRLRLFSDDVPHSLLLKDLGIDQTVTKSHPSDVTFTPKQDGDFHGECGRFCGSGHGNMVFTVHVTGN